MKKIISILLILVLAFSMAACTSEKETTDLVKVGDTVINSKQLDEYIALVGYISGTSDMSQIPEEQMEEIKSVMLDNMIELEALNQYYKDKKDEVLPDTIEDDYKKFIEDSKSNETIKAFLDKENISEDTLKTFFYSQYYSQSLFEEAAATIPTLEDDIKAYYEKNKENYKVDEIRASHILIGDKEHKPEDKALAEEVLQKIKDGASFEEMAKEYGTDGTKDKGGDLGWFGKGDMVSEFENAAYALKKGELSGVVETEFGYHIIKLTDKREYKPYDDVYLEIKQSIVDPVYSEKINKVKKEIGVEYLSDEVKKPETDKK
ncbi:peptidylprolyl isomerase [Anaerovorax odorimutans]|uniref:peptidylprolyl isomerase n=1 Tax=Anaerovorax odorimutans TaxID=109327 RepID=UPI0004029FAE|nr:peptidylprolyl isomerase [Anaerovorax odorimutans]